MLKAWQNRFNSCFRYSSNLKDIPEMVCFDLFCQGTKYAWENGMLILTIVLHNEEGRVEKRDSANKRHSFKKIYLGICFSFPLYYCCVHAGIKYLFLFGLYKSALSQYILPECNISRKRTLKGPSRGTFKGYVGPLNRFRVSWKKFQVDSFQAARNS